MLVAGCGSDRDELTKAEFVTQADAICVNAKKHLRKQARAERGSVDFVGVLIEILNTEADEIDALEGPSSDADRIDAIVGAVREAANTLEANQEDLARAAPQAERAEKLADEYGLKACLIT